MASSVDRALPLPPLNALRVFEAAARHGSFTRAARELCVTQTAVSHQVRLLETHLGAALFARSPGKIELTHDGRAWAAALGDVFARLHAANRSLRAATARARPLVSVSVLPSFASRWLVPRLGRFFARQPDVDVRVSPSEQLVDFSRDGIDVGIRYGLGRYPGLVVDKLCDDAWVVVCAPTVLERARLRTAADLARVPLLRDDEPDVWASWLARRGVRGVDPTRGPELSDSSMVVEAAVRGQGVALARLALCADELATGRLVRPFPRLKPEPTGRAYYLAIPAASLQRPEVAAFRDWVRAEIRSLDGAVPPATRATAGAAPTQAGRRGGKSRATMRE